MRWKEVFRRGCETTVVGTGGFEIGGEEQLGCMFPKAYDSEISPRLLTATMG